MRFPLLRAFSDIRKMKKYFFSINTAATISSKLKPFVYILFPAKIIDELIGEKNIKNIMWLSFIAIFLNFVLSVLNYYLENRQSDNYFWIDMTEKNLISSKLFDVDYNNYQSSSMKKKIIRHKDETESKDGTYCSCLCFIDSIVSAIVVITVSLFSMRSFLHIFFIDAGPSFFESKLFVICVVLCVLVVGGLFALLSMLVNKKAVKLRDEYAEVNSVYEYYRSLVCNYKKGKEIRIYKLQEYIKKHASDELLDKGGKLQNSIANYYAVLSGAGAIIFTIILFGFCIIIGVRARAGLCSIGDMVVCVGCFQQISEAIRTFSSSIGYFTLIKSRIKLFYEILDIKTNEEIEYSDKKVRLFSDNFQTLECKSLSFKYGINEKNAVDDVSIKINLGDKIAVIGENGSGKTTFIKLICGLCEPTKGSIFLNGVNIKDIRKADYFKYYSVIFQDYNLFSLPLGENVSVSEIVDKDKANGLLLNFDFNKKYSLSQVLYKDCDTNGIEISGGEAQKIALARTMYKESPILILDEPTASLDPYAEYKLYKQFNELTEGRTVFYITHRLSSCRFCNKIAVFSNGKLVQYGNHDELVNDQSGCYYKLWNAQAKYYT